MYPGTHSQLGDEDIATLGEQDWCLRRDHLDFGVRFHHLLDTSEWQLVNLVVVIICFQMIDDMLPVGRQYIAGCSLETLIDLLFW